MRYAYPEDDGVWGGYDSNDDEAGPLREETETGGHEAEDDDDDDEVIGV